MDWILQVGVTCCSKPQSLLHATKRHHSRAPTLKTEQSSGRLTMTLCQVLGRYLSGCIRPGLHVHVGRLPYCPRRPGQPWPWSGNTRTYVHGCACMGAPTRYLATSTGCSNSCLSNGTFTIFVLPVPKVPGEQRQLTNGVRRKGAQSTLSQWWHEHAPSDSCQGLSASLLSCLSTRLTKRIFAIHCHVLSSTF